MRMMIEGTREDLQFNMGFELCKGPDILHIYEAYSLRIGEGKI